MFDLRKLEELEKGVHELDLKSAINYMRLITKNKDLQPLINTITIALTIILTDYQEKNGGFNVTD